MQTLQLYLKYENIHTKRAINLIENNTITIKDTFRVFNTLMYCLEPNTQGAIVYIIII